MIKSILVIGDSLVEGYGVMEEDNWVSLLQEALKPIPVSNQGKNGDFIGNIFLRLKQALAMSQYDLVFFEGGVNDFMVGRQVDEVVQIIEDIQQFLSKSGQRAIYLSPPFPVLEGEEAFFPVHSYKPLLKKIQELEAGVPGDVISLNDTLSQNGDYFIDGVHPNEAGHKKIFELIFNYGLKRSFWWK